MRAWKKTLLWAILISFPGTWIPSPAHAFGGAKPHVGKWYPFGQSRPTPEKAEVKPTNVTFWILCNSPTECATLPEGWDAGDLLLSAKKFLTLYMNPPYAEPGKSYANFVARKIGKITDSRYFNIVNV